MSPVRTQRAPNKQMLLPGADVLKEVAFVCQRAHVVRASNQRAKAGVARSRFAVR